MNAELQADIAALTDSVKRFTLERIAPRINAWEEAGEFPRELYAEVAALGLLGLGYPEALGGTPAPFALRNAVSTTMARYSGSGGVMAGLFSLNIGLPPVLRHGSEDLQRQVIPPVLAGERIAALAITEPDGGSDVAALRTTARRDGSNWVVNGEKVFITSGMRADWITMAVRTGDGSGSPGLARGAGGISMLLVPGDTAGLSRTALDKMGWWCSDTAHLRMDNVRVPARYLLGEEGAGFRMIMTNFNGERLGMSAMALGFAQACYDEALDWARQRRTFGSALVEKQVIRHKLVDMQMCIASGLGGAGLHAEEPFDPGHAILCRPGGADPWWHGLHARHQERADLPRGQGDDDRRRGARDHEGPGRASAGAMNCPPAVQRPIWCPERHRGLDSGSMDSGSGPE